MESNWQESWEETNLEERAGGQAKVVQVFQKDNPERVGALKLMHVEQAKNSSRRKRLIQEIHTIKKLNGNGVPEIYDFNEGDKNNSPYFISEWIEGFDLDEYCKVTRIDIKKAIGIVRKLALIVDSCHQQGIVHRDIKPQNIRIRKENEEPILVDFGISWVSDITIKQSKRTQIGEELGNRFLRLPELTAGSSTKHDNIIDVTFLIGLLFYLITKKAPRQLRDAGNLMPHERLAAKELSLLSSDFLWERIQRVFNVGFQQDSRLRFQSCIDLVKALDNALIIKSKDMLNPKNKLKEVKSKLANLLNSEIINAQRKTVKEFNTINNKLVGYVRSELSEMGMTVGTNEIPTSVSHRTNMHITSDITNKVVTIISHNIKIEDNKLKASYIIESKYRENQQMKSQILLNQDYFEGHIPDLVSLSEAIENNRESYLSIALEEFQNKISQQL